MKTKLIITGFFWFLTTATTLMACPVCEKRQPAGFANITHGTGPEGAFDYWMLYGSIGVVILTLLLYIRFIIRPETAAMRHLKQHGFADWNHE